MNSENQPLQTTEEKRSQNFFLANIKVITRSMGFITVTVLWMSTVIIVKDHKESYVGYFLIAVSSLVTFFELTWIMDKLACCVREGCCCRVWSAIMWVDNWKKFLLYVVLSIPLFLEDMRLILGIVSGLLLILLSTLYLIKTFRSSVSLTYQKTEIRQVVAAKTPEIHTVSHEISTQTEIDHIITTTYTTSEVSEDGGATNSAIQ